MRALFVDDEVERFKEYTWNNPRIETDYAKNVIHAKRLLSAFPYDILLLDHDMTSEGEDGADLARWIVKNPDIPKHRMTVFCHSINFDGRRDMLEIFKPTNVAGLFDLPFAWKKTIYAHS